jgi:hypothetical protein
MFLKGVFAEILMRKHFIAISLSLKKFDVKFNLTSIQKETKAKLVLILNLLQRPLF